MKKIVLILLIIFTNNVFSQSYSDSSSGKFDKMANLSNQNKNDDAKKIADELLSGKYGELSGFQKFYALLVVADYYYQKDDYQKASDAYQQFLDFNKNENPKKIDNKKIYIDEAKGKLEELKPKLSLVSANTNNVALVKYAAKEEPNKTSEINSLNGNIASENSTIQADKKETNTDKTVTLTVSGTGKTLEEAKTNALRSAIEQAFGAFISSKTEILNDNLVKDEIVSVTNGNIQKFEIISQVEIPNSGYAMTLNATVSISKLTSFAESKGVAVEFKGGLFGINIKLQKLNEDAELVAIKNLLDTSFDILDNSIDFELEVSEPKLSEDDLYNVDFTINMKSNSNYNKFEDYFVNTIKKLSLSSDEILEYNNLNKKVYKLFVNDKIYTFRTIHAKVLFINFFVASQILANSFKLYSNEGIVKFTYNDLYDNLIFGGEVRYGQKKGILLSAYQSPYSRIVYDDIGKNKYKDNLYYITPFFGFYVHNINLNRNDLFSILPFNLNEKVEFNIQVSFAGNGLHITTDIFFDTEFSYPKLGFTKTFKLSELEKINKFSIERVGIEEFLRNRFLYMNPEPKKNDYGCFSANTKIATVQGVKNIQDIKVGDKVICFDDKGELHTSIVESVNKHDNQDVYKYSIWNGEALYATSNHWVLTSENSFSEIGKLNEMLTLVDINGGLKPITKVEYFGKETVYNFIVKDYHTYIANDIRVHNGGKGKYHMNISKK